MDSGFSEWIMTARMDKEVAMFDENLLKIWIEASASG